METKETQPQDEMWKKWEKEHRRGKIIGGTAIVIAGVLFLARELGVIFPEWLFTWKVLLITIGLVIGIKHGFRNFKWLIPIIIGTAFLISDLFPGLALKPLLWPLIVILVGLFIIFKPHTKRRRMRWEKWKKHNKYAHYYKDCYHGGGQHNNEDILDSTAFMAGVKKNILSKNFKRGDVTAVFSGTELNFSQADFTETAELDLTAVFGGISLIIPSNWEIKSEVVCAFGSVEDNRAVQPLATNELKKVLNLSGTVFMGGIEIKNY